MMGRPKDELETLAELYGPELSDQKLAELQGAGPSVGGRVASGLAGLGDAISNSYGRGNTDYQGDIQRRADMQKRQAVADFLMQRKGKQEGFQFGEKQEEKARSMDERSKTDLAMQSLAKRLDPSGSYDGMSAIELAPVIEELRAGRKRSQAVEDREDEQAFRQRLKEMDIARTSQGVKLSPAQKSLDQKFATTYNEFVNEGGYAETLKSLDQLNEVQEALKTESLTGPIQGRVPDFIRSFTNPEAIDMREAVEGVVQKNLKKVLGGQFTEREGEKLVKRAYNETLPEDINRKRVTRLMEQMKNAADATMKASKYYEENGTLAGYKGRPVQSFDDFYRSFDESLKQDEQDLKRQRYEELKAKQTSAQAIPSGYMGKM